MPKKWILEDLKQIEPIEQSLLDGKTTIEQVLYVTGQTDIICSKELLSDNELIAVRRHTRLFPSLEHGHDYIELVYVCSGQMHHIIEGKQIVLNAGDFLFLSPQVRHEISVTGMDDIAVNFIVLPEFLESTLSAIGDEPTSMRRFLMDCLFGGSSGPRYLLFRVGDDVQVQNLAENLIITLLYSNANRRKISQATLTLLFLELLDRTEKLDLEESDSMTLNLLQYVDRHYADGSLTQAAAQLHCDIYTLSREVQRKTGKTYTQLIQEKRLSQAAFLLHNTDWTIDNIARTVGYENMSYFYKLFQKHFGESPRRYRLSTAGSQERGGS